MCKQHSGLKVLKKKEKTHFFVSNVSARMPQFSSVAKYGGESAQTKIIVVLFRQLLSCQGTQGEYLLCQHLLEQRQDQSREITIP